MSDYPSFEIPAQARLQAYIGEYGHVVLKQDNPNDEDQYIVLDPEQIPTIIDWLQQLLTALENTK